MDRLQEQDQLVANLKLELKRESILRKKAFNHIRELKGNIQVIARIRPTQNGLDLASRASFFPNQLFIISLEIGRLYD